MDEPMVRGSGKCLRNMLMGIFAYNIGSDLIGGGGTFWTIITAILIYGGIGWTIWNYILGWSIDNSEDPDKKGSP